MKVVEINATSFIVKFRSFFHQTNKPCRWRRMKINEDLVKESQVTNNHLHTKFLHCYILHVYYAAAYHSENTQISFTTKTC